MKYIKFQIIFFTIFILLIKFSVLNSQVIPVVDSLKNILKVEQNDSIKIELYKKIGKIFYRNNMPDSALQYLKKGILSTGKNISERADCYFYTAEILYDKKKYPEALKSYFMSVDLFKKVNNNEKLGIVNDRIASIYYFISMYDKALLYLKKSLIYLKKTKNEKYIGQAYNNIGILYRNKKQYKTALSYYTESISIRKKIGDSIGLAKSYNNIGSLFLYLHQSDKAENYYNKSSEIKKKLKDTLGICATYNNLSNLFIEKGDSTNIIYQKKKFYQKSIYFSEKVLYFSELTNDNISRFYAAENISAAYKKLGNYKKALKFYELYSDLKDTISGKEKIKAIQQAEIKSLNDKLYNKTVLLKQKQYLLERNEQESKKSKMFFIIAIVLLLILVTYITFTNRKLKKTYQKIKDYSEELNYSEKKFRFLFEKVPFGIFIVNPDGSISDANGSLLKIIGSPSVEETKKINVLKFKNLVECGYSEDIKKCFKEGKITRKLYQYNSAWGKNLYLQGYNFPIKNETGEIEKVYCVVEDVTKRIITEREKDENQERLLTLINASPDIICFKDGEGKWLLANDADLELFNLKEVDYFGKDDLELAEFTAPIFKESFKYCKYSDELAWDKGDILRNEEIITTVNNERKIYDVFKVPVFNEDGTRKGLVVLGRDITENKENVKKLIKAKEEAENANRLKNEFLANMSHEIRTPMNAIVGFSEILAEKLENPELKTYTDRVISSSNSLLRLIEDILDISKIEAGYLEITEEVTEVRKIADDVYKLFSEKADKKGIDFKLKIDENIPEKLLLDDFRFKQIMINLVDNAVKFTEKGMVEFYLFAENKSGNKLNLGLKVKDTGIGIKPEEKDFVFENFRQSENRITEKYGGTGLGLAITKKLCKLMNGNISVRSEVGIGSEFTVILNNVKISDKEHKIKEKVETVNLKSKKIKILLAEDNLINRQLIVALLENHSFEIIEVVNGKEVLEYLEKDIPDVILMDIQMPVLDGYETTKILKKDERFKNIPVIALTAHAIKEKVAKYRTVFDDYLIKPIKREKILESISQIIK